MTAAVTAPRVRVIDPLVDAAVAGDDRAFATLVERHRRELVGHCTRLLRSPDHAEDAVQEALLRAWRSRSDFAGRATFRSWLHRIATNTCLDEMRRRRATVPLDDVRLPAASAGPEAVAEAGEALEHACNAVLGALLPRQRAVLILRGFLDVPASETAALLGLTVAAVNSALQRARAAVRGHLPSAPGPAGSGLLADYVDALRRDDVARVVALARADLAGPCPRAARE